MEGLGGARAPSFLQTNRPVSDSPRDRIITSLLVLWVYIQLFMDFETSFPGKKKERVPRKGFLFGIIIFCNSSLSG